MRRTFATAMLIMSASVAVIAASNSSASKAASAKVTPAPASVTIMGCLERDDESFRLTETSGAHAPKSRSWKSGFLKKRTADLDIVDASKSLKLQNHVGHRVAMSGAVKEGEFRVRSLRHVKSSCIE